MQPTQSPSSSVSAATAAILQDERRVRWVLNALNNKLIQPLRRNVLGAASTTTSKTGDAELKRKKELQQKYRFSTAFPVQKNLSDQRENEEDDNKERDIDDNFLSPVYVPQLSKGQLQALFAHWDSLLAAHELFINHLEESFQAKQEKQEEGAKEEVSGRVGGHTENKDPTLVALEALQHPVVTYFLAEHGSYCVNFAKNTAPTLMFLHAAASFMGGLLADVPPVTGFAAPSTLINEFSVLFRSVNKPELEQYVSEAMDHVRFSFAAQGVAFSAANTLLSKKSNVDTNPKPSLSASSWMSTMLHASEASLFGEHASRLISCDNNNTTTTSPNCEGSNKLWKSTIGRNINRSNTKGVGGDGEGKRLFDKPQGPFEELLLAMGVVLGSRYRIIEFQRCLTNNIKMQLVRNVASTSTSSPLDQHQKQQQASHIAVLSTAADLEQRWLETVRVAAKMAARTVSQHHTHTPLLRVIEQTQNPKQKNYRSRTDLLARICPPTNKSTRATSGGSFGLQPANNSSDNSNNTKASPIKSRLASFWSSSTSRDASPETAAAAAAVMEPRVLIREGRVHKRYGRVGGTHPRYLALWEGLLCYFEEVAEEQKTVAPLRTALDSMWTVESAAATAHMNNKKGGGGKISDGGHQQQHVDPAQERRERMQARLQQAGVIYASNSMVTTTSATVPGTDSVGMAKRRVGGTRQPPVASTLHQQQGIGGADKRFVGGNGGKAGFFGSCCTADALEEGPLRSNTPTTIDDDDSYPTNATSTAYTDLAAATSSKNGADMALQSALTETGHILLQQALLPHHQAVDHGGYLLSRFRNLSSSTSKQIDDTNNKNADDGIIAAGDFSSSRFAQRRAKLSRALQRARAAGNKSSIIMENSHHHNEDDGTARQEEGVEDSNNISSSKKLSAFNQRMASINNEGPGVLIRYRLCSMFEPETFKISIPGITADFILLQSSTVTLSGIPSPPSLRLDEAYRSTVTTSTYQSQSEEQERQSRSFELIVPERRYVFYTDSFEEKLLWVKDICKMLLDRGNGDRIIFPDDPTFISYEMWVNINKAKTTASVSDYHQISSTAQSASNVVFTESAYDTLEDQYSPTGAAPSFSKKGGLASPSHLPHTTDISTTANNRLSLATIAPESELDIMAHKCFPTAPPPQTTSSTTTKDNTDAFVINFKSRLAQQTALLGSAVFNYQHAPSTSDSDKLYLAAHGGESGNSAFPAAVRPPRAFFTTTSNTHPLNPPDENGVQPVSSDKAMSMSMGTPTLPPKTPLLPMISTPGILQRRGSFRNSCRPGSISGVVGGGNNNTPRSHHHHRTLSSNQNSHLAARTPMSASFAGRTASFTSLPEETFGTPNSATTPLHHPRHAPSNSIGGTFADERQLFPIVTLNSGNCGEGGPLYSPNDNIHDDDNDTAHDYNQKLPLPPTHHQRRATFDSSRDDNTTGPLSLAHHRQHPQIHRHHERQFSMPGSYTTIPSPTSEYTALGAAGGVGEEDVLLMPAHSGSFVDHGADEHQYSPHSQRSYRDVDEQDAATSNIPLSEMRRRAVLEELAIIDSDSNSSSDSIMGGDDTIDGKYLEY